MDFQQVIMRLDEFWADQGCLLWQPHNVQVGAGTGNPATSLRVLGAEPWRVAYLEPSIRPDDGRYGDNPNRWQRFYQYQVILKPDPGNPQELYLESLRALGIDTSAHDVRFVEDNWEAPALGAWGLGWEVWLDGQEITQYTYFQQAGGLDLDPVSVEITYGVERIVMVLQGVERFHDIRWRERVTYGGLHLQDEIEQCTYNFEVADVGRLGQMYDLCEAEAQNALARGLVLPAHDYVLKCSHIFNVLDARGAVGVAERARYFVRMRNLARQVASLYVRQREQMGHPFQNEFPAPVAHLRPTPSPNQPQGDGPHDLLLEIGSEELPAKDLDSGVAQLEEALSSALAKARLGYESLRTMGTPRRLVAYVRGLEARQEDAERKVKGPPAQIAYDGEGNPTRAALGFARSQGVEVSALQTRQIEGKEYVVAVVQEAGRESSAVLAELLPEVVAAMQFPLSMRWNASGASFSRPLRWFVALLDDAVLPFEHAGVRSGRGSRGIRPKGSPEILIRSARDYFRVMEEEGIQLDVKQRVASILGQARALAAEVGGELADDPDLLREVANLVEYPLAIRGTFDEQYLSLPAEVLLAVMRVHQRYLSVMRDGHLLPHFIAVANGPGLDVGLVRRGNEGVLRARYADAAFFYDADTKVPLEEFTPRLATLTFQEQLGSVLDKVGRLERLVPELCGMLGLSPADTEAANRAATLCKSDLATQLVVELTTLQGKMGRHYAERSGEPKEVALAIEEHYLPRFTGDRLPQSMAGVVVGLADRLDTLVGLFAVGVRPTGAADPWGLRRAALGVTQVWEGKGIIPPLLRGLPEALRQAASCLPVEADDGLLQEVYDFVDQRLGGHLTIAKGYRRDIVSAVTTAGMGMTTTTTTTSPAGTTTTTLLPATSTAGALDRWRQRPDWQENLDTYARCVRITRDETEVHTVDKYLLTEPAERALYDAYRAVAPRVRAEATVDALFEAILELKPFIRKFFDEVLVMTQDLALRNNRLGLLQAIGSLADGIVNLREMEGF